MAVPRPLLRGGAAVFLTWLAAYSAASIYYNPRRFPTATLGLDSTFSETEPAMRVDRVEAGGPADRAGLRAGDRILAVDGRALTSIYPVWDAVDRGRPGATVRLAVRRPEDEHVGDVLVQLEPYRLPRDTPWSGTQLTALWLLTLFPIPFLVVAAVVLIQRLHDRHAWLLALMFGSYIVSGLVVPELVPVVHPLLRKPLLASWALLGAFVGPGALYAFFASFPEPTPLDRRLPWLKWFLLAAPLTGGAILAVTLVLTPNPLILSPEARSRNSSAALNVAFGIFGFTGYALALASLVWNAFAARPETRRRTRVMLWGTAMAVLPVTVLLAYTEYRGMEFIALPFWLWVGALLSVLLLPISIAYAVVRHRVMEIPVLLRRSARYVLVHHAIVTVGVVVGIALTLLLVWPLSRMLSQDSPAIVSAGPVIAIAVALVGIAMALATRLGVRKATERLDRAFFREAYDARRLLLDLARRSGTATDRQALAALLEGSLNDALHPSAILVLLRTSTDRLEASGPSAGTPPLGLDAAPVDRETLTKAGAILVEPGSLSPPLAPLAVLQPDLLAPMRGHQDQLEGLLVLGPRLSDEPYGREDRELIASVASQAGTALQNLRLASIIAERMEIERVTQRELEIAREVQAKLLPQRAPAVESLDYAGICIQAREVGGDYYDFLYLGPGQLSIVLADISGKGISAALLMASLQANLRSHHSQASDDLPRLLRAVNQTFFDSTETSRYATLFLGTYDQRTSRLRFANCGHPPPMLFGADGSIERLRPTGPAVGLFEEWSCTTGEVVLGCQDTLVMFTDGVVEAFNAQGEEFGEDRLLEVVQKHPAVPAAGLLDAVVAAVQRHSGPARSDDLTLVVARGRAQFHVAPLTPELT